jgi:hypothetical protein
MSAFMPNKTSSVWTFGNTARVTSRCSGLANNHEQVKICLQSAAVWRMSAYSCVRLGSLGSCSMAGERRRGSTKAGIGSGLASGRHSTNCGRPWQMLGKGGVQVIENFLAPSQCDEFLQQVEKYRAHRTSPDRPERSRSLAVLPSHRWRASLSLSAPSGSALLGD